MAALREATEAHWQNPSSLYRSAGEVRNLLEEAREQVAESFGIAEPSRVIFTSGATEANNLFVRHISNENPNGRLIVSSIEHPSLMAPACDCFRDRLTTVKVDTAGLLSLQNFESELEKDRPACVSIMTANNETGVLQPWQEIRGICDEKEIPFHCDASQWIGKLDTKGLGDCDWLTGSAHKFGGVKGAGFLIVPEDLRRLSSAPLGGPQEQGMRAGTENYPAIAAMVAALEYSCDLVANGNLKSDGRDAFETAILEALPDVRVCGKGVDRLWNTSMLIMPAHKNLKWLARLSHMEFAVSTGSACSSGADNASHVMEAMGLDTPEMNRTLRFSSGWQTTVEDWLELAKAVVELNENLNTRNRVNL